MKELIITVILFLVFAALPLAFIFVAFALKEFGKPIKYYDEALREDKEEGERSSF